MKADKLGARARATRRLLLALLICFSAAMVLHWASLTFLWSGADNRSSRSGIKPGPARRPGLSRKQEACVAAAVDSSAGVHSRIEKAGPLDIRLWHANHTEWRNDAFRKWATRGVINPHSSPHSRVGLEGHVLVTGPPAFPHCRVFVNHAYKVIYLRAPKVASTTILDFFGSCGRPGQGGNKTTCLSPLEVGSSEEYAALWHSYFVFGFTRNPWSRAVSSYRMLERYLAPNNGGTGCHAAATWRTFCADPSSVGRLHREMPDCSRPGRGEGFALHHIIAQEPCLAAAGRGLAADWLGRMEHLEADLGELVALLEARRAAATPEAPPLDIAAAAALKNVNGVACVDARGKAHARSSHGQGCDIRGYFTGENGACFRQIAHFYKGDVVSLKFPDCTSGPAG